MSEICANKSEELERLIIQKRRLQNEIEIMEKQQDEYNKNKQFYDKLILFHQKVAELRIIKEELISRNQELNKTNERIKMRIREVQEAKNCKEDQEKLLDNLLEEVTRIKNSQ